MVQLYDYPEIHKPYGGVGLPVEPRENRSVCKAEHIITTTGRNLLLVVDIHNYLFHTMDVTGHFEWINMRTVDFPDQSHLPEHLRKNRPSQTHYNRMILANLYGYSCMRCGRTGHLTVDHVIPRAENGWSSLSNLQLLCKKCNVSKAATYTDYRWETPAEIFWQWAIKWDKEHGAKKRL